MEAKRWIKEQVNEQLSTLLASYEREMAKAKEFAREEYLRKLTNCVCTHATTPGHAPFTGFEAAERDQLLDEAIGFLQSLKTKRPPRGKRTLRPPHMEEFMLPRPKVCQDSIGRLLSELESDSCIVSACDLGEIPSAPVSIDQRFSGSETFYLGIRWGKDTIYPSARSTLAIDCSISNELLDTHHPSGLLVDLRKVPEIIESDKVMLIISYETEMVRVYAAPRDSWSEMINLGHTMVYSASVCTCVAILPPM